MKKKHNIPFVISAFIFSFSIIALVFYIFSINSEEGAFEEVRKEIKRSVKVKQTRKEEKSEKKGLDYYLIDGEVVQEEFKDLYLLNNDIIGWIRIEDTPIDYPVMYTPEDTEYYIHRDFNQEYCFGGCIFAGEGTDIERPCDNLITYGHHMANASMYHDLDKYESEDYYREHKYITFDSLQRTGKYEVIAAFRTAIYPEDYKGFVYWKFVNASNKDDFDDFISNCKALTPYDISVSAEYGDQLITLSTCAYHTLNGRFVVVAKRVEGEEVDLERKPVGNIMTE